MREILFKAKRIDNDEWVEGYYLYCKGAKTVSFQNEHFILVFDGYGVAWREIDKKTICQYTGLKDDKGNKIWENDVATLGADDLEIGFIKYRQDNVRFVFCDEEGDEYGFDNTCVIEVIGNIFDNPELVKE